MSKRNNNRGAAPGVSPERPPEQGTLHANTRSGGTKGNNMEWIRVKSQGNKGASRARQIFQQRLKRSIRVGRLETLVQIRNGEGHYLDRLGRDLGFTWRHCQVPEAETGGPIVTVRCGVEVAGSMKKSHQSSCKACRRVVDPTFERKRRSDAKVPEPVSYSVDVSPEEIDEVIDKAESTPMQKLVDEVIDAPTPMAALIKGLEARERRAFGIAEACGVALKALQAVEASDAALKELQAQLDADRKRLAAFIGAEGGPQ